VAPSAEALMAAWPEAATRAVAAAQARVRISFIVQSPDVALIGSEGVSPRARLLESAEAMYQN